MDIRKKIEELQKRNSELKPIVFKPFENVKDLNAHRETNIEIITEYYDNQQEIEGLRWELMTPEEREKKEEYMRKLKIKREG